MSPRAGAPVLALLVAGVGCESPRAIPGGLTNELKEQVEFCESMDEDVEDWCVFQAMHDSINVRGEPYYLLCKSMTNSDARDACLETLARTDESSGYAEICAEIQQVRMRESCYLMRAEQTMRSSPSIFDAVAACQKTGSLAHHCLGHVPAQRKGLWQRQAGLQSLYMDLQAILSVAPKEASQTGVGFGFGTAAREMGGAQGISICQAFGNTDAGRGCMEAATSGAPNLSGGGAGGAIPGGMAPP